MENTAVLKRFTINMSVAVGAFVGMWLLGIASERVFGESLYALLAVLIVFFVYMTYSMSKNQVESEAREQKRQQAEAQRKIQRQMLTE